MKLRSTAGVSSVGDVLDAHVVEVEHRDERQFVGRQMLQCRFYHLYGLFVLLLEYQCQLLVLYGLQVYVAVIDIDYRFLSVSHEVERFVIGDTAHPRRQRSLTAVIRSDVAEHLNKHILIDLLGIFMVGYNSGYLTEDHLAIEFECTSLCLSILTAKALYEFVYIFLHVFVLPYIFIYTQR